MNPTPACRRLSEGGPRLAATSDVATPAWRVCAVGADRLWRDGDFAASTLLADLADIRTAL